MKLPEGNVFTSVCDSVHREVSLTETPLLDRDPAGQRLPGQRSPWTEIPSLDRDPSPWTETQTENPCTVKRGRYASYWNAFFLPNTGNMFVVLTTSTRFDFRPPRKQVSSEF